MTTISTLREISNIKYLNLMKWDADGETVILISQGWHYVLLMFTYFSLLLAGISLPALVLLPLTLA